MEFGFDNIIEFVKISCNWTDKYTREVLFEYERFLILRESDNQLSPSDDIDRFWHIHILCSQHYTEYCLSKFNKYIHHNALDSMDQPARLHRLSNTLNEYTKHFGDANKLIWTNNVGVGGNDQTSINFSIGITPQQVNSERLRRQLYEQTVASYTLKPNKHIVQSNPVTNKNIVQQPNTLQWPFNLWSSTETQTPNRYC